MLMAASPVPVPTVQSHCPSRTLPTRALPPRDVRCDISSPPRPRTPTAVGPTALASSQVVRSEGLAYERDPPVLRETPLNLAYRGEGADHIVLRLLGSGQVLRLRKTPVGGAVTSRKDLIQRATRDEEFLQNVARPILGPLLTDESRLVIVDPDTLTSVRDTLQARRQGHRQHKEINQHGVACICPDAASIFIDRRGGSSSSSSSSLPRPPAVPSPATSAPPAESQGTTDAPNLRESQATTSTNGGTDDPRMIARGGRPLEKEYNHARTTTGTPGDDAAATAAKEEGVVRGTAKAGTTRPEEPKNVCIEIKPKQGFLDRSTPGLPLCRYCVKQFLKRVKDGHPRSRYCPLDLFSGDLQRMRRAVDGLIQSPQNNFKVFLEGEPMDDCRPFSYLRDVIIAAMTFDFASSCSAGLPGNHGALSPRSALGRILAFQSLDQLGVFRATRLYQALVRRMGSSLATDTTLQDLNCWSTHSHLLQPVREDLKCGARDTVQRHASSLDHANATTRRRKHQCVLKNGSRKGVNCESPAMLDFEDVATANHVDLEDLESTNTSSAKPSHEKWEVETPDGEEHLVGDVGEDEAYVSQEEMVRSLQKYLLSTTAKDLSLMILLSGPHTSAPPPCTDANTSPFIITLESGVWYKCQVTGVDLVAKPSSKILKHERDYQLLRDVLLDLRSRGQEPICCRL